MCSLQCAVCSVQCAVCSVQCAVCSVEPPRVGRAVDLLEHIKPIILYQFKSHYRDYLGGRPAATPSSVNIKQRMRRASETKTFVFSKKLSHY